jgi:hypothetical protein
MSDSTDGVYTTIVVDNIEKSFDLTSLVFLISFYLHVVWTKMQIEKYI